MGRSPGFGSAACDSIARLRLAFATAPRLKRLTSPHTSNSPAHYAKGTPSALPEPKSRVSLRPLVSRWFQVLLTLRQESFSPFPHGTCALSVVREYLALGGGPPRFPQGFSCPVVLGNRLQRAGRLSLTGLSPSLVGLSRRIQLTCRFLTLRSYCTQIRDGPTTPLTQRVQALTCQRFWLFPFRSPLLRKSRFLSTPRGT